MNEDDCPDLSVCGSEPPENHEEKQYTSDPQERLEYRKLWRCKSCLTKNPPDNLVQIGLNPRKIIQTTNDGLLERTKMFTKMINSILFPESFRKKVLNQDPQKEELAAITDLPFESCPWEWKHSELCQDLMQLENMTKINTGLYDPDKINKRLWDGLSLLKRSRAATESYWWKKRKEKREMERNLHSHG